MKKTLLLFFVIFGCKIAFSQSNSIVVKSATSHNYSKNDTIPEVVKPNDWEINKPLFEINNRYTSTEVYSALTSDNFENVEAVKGDFNFFGKNYKEKINVTLKANAKVNLISVSELISKYTNLKNDENYIYSVDGEIIIADPKSALVDEKNIMQIKVYKLDYLKNNSNLSLVKILTRTEANISKANEILIR